MYNTLYGEKCAKKNTRNTSVPQTAGTLELTLSLEQTSRGDHVSFTVSWFFQCQNNVCATLFKPQKERGERSISCRQKYTYESQLVPQKETNNNNQVFLWKEITSLTQSTSSLVRDHFPIGEKQNNKNIMFLRVENFTATKMQTTETKICRWCFWPRIFNTRLQLETTGKDELNYEKRNYVSG